MRQEKHQALVDAKLQQEVHAAAYGAGVSVDELVHAAHSRPASPAARMGLAKLTADQRKQLAEVPWPYECAACGRMTETLVRCSSCGREACDACQMAGDCQDCRDGAAAKTLKTRQAAEREASIARTRKAQAERAAAAKAAARAQDEPPQEQ